MKVFQFVQGIAHIWDGHEAALINRETALKVLPNNFLKIVVE